VRGEADENAQRLGFAPEEALDVYDDVLEEESWPGSGSERRRAEPASKAAKPGAASARRQTFAENPRTFVAIVPPIVLPPSPATTRNPCAWPGRSSGAPLRNPTPSSRSARR
jgi:hypothetical protein